MIIEEAWPALEFSNVKNVSRTLLGMWKLRYYYNNQTINIQAHSLSQNNKKKGREKYSSLL